MNASDLPIPMPMDRIADFCRRWKITEFALFGSVLRDDFGPESDVDVLVTFEREAPWSLFDIATMRDELARIVGRPVNILERRAVESHNNPIRKASILRRTRTLYAA